MAKQFTVDWVVLGITLYIRWESKYYGFAGHTHPREIALAQSEGGLYSFAYSSHPKVLCRLGTVLWATYTYNKTTAEGSTMNTTQYKISVMQAADAGKTIQVSFTTASCINEWQTVEVGNTFKWDWQHHNYRVATEWFENIPLSGILCHVSDGIEGTAHIESVISFDNTSNYPYITSGTSYLYAKPLTEIELKRFTQAAREAHKGDY